MVLLQLVKFSEAAHYTRKAKAFSSAFSDQAAFGEGKGLCLADNDEMIEQSDVNQCQSFLQISGQ
jgi:hypothetical protein